MILHFDKSDRNGVTVLEFKGSIHSGPDCRQLEKEIESIIHAGHNKLVLDLTHLTHIDSSAIGSIVRCISKIKGADGMMRIAGPTGMVEQAFKITQLHKVIEIFPTVAEAVQRFNPPA